MKVYLAGPIRGLTYKEAAGWRNYVTGQLASGIQTISPLRGMQMADEEILNGKPLAAIKARAIVRQDLYDIRRCDIMLANLLDMKEKSIGTLVEMGYAAAWNKLIIAVIDKDSNYDHPFISEIATVLNNLDEAISLILATADQNDIDLRSEMQCQYRI